MSTQNSNKTPSKNLQVKEEIKKVVHQEIEPLIKDIRTVTTQISKVQIWQGPVPHPEDLKRFDKVVPGTGKKLINQFIKQSDHRMSIENKVVSSNIKKESIGQIFGFTLMLLIIAGGFTMVFLDKDVVGMLFAASGFGGILALFFAQKSKSRKELQNKNQSRQNKSTSPK